MADFLTYTARYLKENGLISENADEKIIQPIIILVQDKYIHPILGSSLFNQIKTQIIAGSVSAQNQTLLDDHLMKVMLWYCLCEVTPAMKYRYMNKGIVAKNGENSTPADLQEIQYIMSRWQKNAEMYAERATNFLKENDSTYTLYRDNPDIDDIKPNKTNYTSSIYMGNDDPERCPGDEY